MASIWTNDGNKWKLTSPSGFPDEATLHKLIQEAPGILPLAGELEIAILGSEVNLGQDMPTSLEWNRMAALLS